MKNLFTFFLVALLPLFGFGQFSCTSANFDLGNDTTLNCAENYTIHAPQGFDSYSWGDGSTADSLVVNQTGTYTCNGILLGPSVVTNGDFSAGNTGFVSSYTVGTGGTYGQLSSEGTYAVNSNANNVHTNFISCFDHTSGNASGSMMIVNGASVANVEIWKQTITVQPNTDYQFSTWGVSVTPANPGQLAFSINGTQIGGVLQLPSTTGVWDEFHVTWNSGTATSVVIAIVNQNTAISGNDFAIDDISFAPVCTYTDDINVTMPAFPQVTIPDTLTMCNQDTLAITAQSTSTIVNYAWDNGENGQTIHVFPNHDTIFTVVGTDDNGCLSQPQEVTVLVNPLPDITFHGEDTVCGGTQAVISATSSLANSSFQWQYDQSTNDTLAVVPDESMNLIVEVTSPLGCSQLDTFHLTATEKLDVTINGDTVLCDGEKSILNATSNLSNTQYVWQPSNMNSSAIQVSESDTGYVYLKGTHPLCGTNMDSVLIVAGKIPTVVAPSNDTICMGDVVNVSASADVSGAVISWFPANLTGENQSFSPAQTTKYYVQANSGGCISALDSFLIVVNPLCDLVVPNVFTPNGDGVNDVFHLVEINGIKKLEGVILNRWGNLIFEINTPDFEWKGMNQQGKKVDDGVYFYKMKATLMNNQELKKYGYIHVINQ